MLGVQTSEPQLRAGDSSVQRQFILLVEDEPSLRRLLGRLLTRASHSVESAGDADEALELLQLHPVTMVITDLHLPRHDGSWLIDRPELSRSMAVLRVLSLLCKYINAVCALRLVLILRPMTLILLDIGSAVRSPADVRVRGHWKYRLEREWLKG